MADNAIEETSNTIELKLEFEDLRFTGRITKLSSPLVINDGVLYGDRATGKKGFWVIQALHAVFEGELQMGANSYHLQGMAYQDHNWGDLPIQNYVSDWIWGHFSNTDLSTVFYRIYSHDKLVIDRTALYTGRTAFAGTEMHTKSLDALASNAMPEAHNADFHLYIPGPNAQLDFQASQDRIMRSRINENHEQFIATYNRWSAQARIHLENSSHVLPGITEYIRIRRKPADAAN